MSKYEEQLVINKALGALMCTKNQHPNWFKAYPNMFLKKRFLLIWSKEKLGVGNAYAMFIKELKINGYVSSFLKRCELSPNELYPIK